MAEFPVHPRKKGRRYGRVKSRKKAEKAGSVLGQKKASEEEMSAAGRTLHSRRYSKMTKTERKAQASTAAQAYWASMSEAERKIEMKRRHRIMKKRRIAARQEKIRSGR
jgi:hypothetical protein